MDKLLPHDIDAEEAMLGAFLIGGQKAFRQVVHQVKDIDLYSERNRWIFKACADLYSRREAINEVTVSQELSRQDKLANIGGAAFLPHLIDSCPTSLDVEYYGKIVYRLSLNRKLIAMSDQLAGIGYQALPDTGKTIEQAVELFDEFKKSSAVIGNDITTPTQAGNDIIGMLNQYSQPANYIKWGFRDLDDIPA
jgi:replicative DNA helicase